MRKNIILLVFFLYNTILFGQNLPVLRTVPVSNTHYESFFLLSGDYIQDNQNLLDEYEGTWLYNQNGVEFTLKLVKKTMVLSSSDNFYVYYDEIVSTYKLKYNGNVLIDNLSVIPSSSNLNLQIFDSFDNGSSLNFIEGSFQYLTTGVLYHCEIRKILTHPSQPQKIQFEVFPQERLFVSPNGTEQVTVIPSPVPIHLLNGIELIKIN